MGVQGIFISINKSAPIINLTLFSIVAVDNHQLAQIIKSIGRNSFPHPLIQLENT